MTLSQLNDMTTEDALRMARADIGRNWGQGGLDFRPYGGGTHVRCAIGSVSHVLDLLSTNGGVDYPSEWPAATKKQKRIKKLAMASLETLYKALPNDARMTPDDYKKMFGEKPTHTELVQQAIIEYNDIPGRHKRTITKWFDRAIAIATK